MPRELGGKAGYEKVKPQDSAEKAPDAQLVRSLLPASTPALILLDELVIYVANLPEHGRRCLLGFVRTLVAEVSARKQAVVVITDPAGQASYRREAAALAEVQAEAARDLDDILARQASDFDPIGSEGAQVIVRRLFEHVDKNEAEKASAEYYRAYQRVSSEYPGAVPSEAATMEYAQRIAACIPSIRGFWHWQRA